MPRYRKKPLVVEAYRTAQAREIATPEGIMRAEIGDWIITGVAGETYPCKDHVFKQTYERIDDEHRAPKGAAP